MTDFQVDVQDGPQASGYASVDTKLVPKAGATYLQQRVIIADENVGSAMVRFQSPLVGGRPSAMVQNLFSVYNGSPSNMMELRKLTVELDQSGPPGASLGGQPILRGYKITAAPTLGTDLTSRKFICHPSQTSHPSIIVRSDGGSVDATVAASVLQASVIGPYGSAPFGQAFPPRQWTLVGQMLTPDQVIVAEDIEPGYLPVIGPNEGFVVRVENIATLNSWPSKTALSFETIWREFDPTI